MPKKSENQIKRQGGAARYRTVKSGDKTMTCAVTRKKGPRGGKTVCWPRESMTLRMINRLHGGSPIEENGFEQDENPSCPVCSGPGVLLGGLGRREYFRCRDCGMDFGHEKESGPEEDASGLGPSEVPRDSDEVVDSWLDHMGGLKEGRDDIDKLPLPDAAKRYARRKGLKSMEQQPKPFQKVNAMLLNPGKPDHFKNYTTGETTMGKSLVGGTPRTF